MEIKVGEIIRTEYGEIFKVTGIYKETIYVDRNVDRHADRDENENFLSKKEIVNHSFNIIDFIEVGDYVNGSKVIDIAQGKTKAIYVEQVTIGALEPILEKDIKSIVTSQQFSSVEYLLEEE